MTQIAIRISNFILNVESEQGHGRCRKKPPNARVSAAATELNASGQKPPLIVAALAVGGKRLLGARLQTTPCPFHRAD
jgi:hypothetical protein